MVRLPAGSRIRPTADRVKESLFNILHSVEGTSFLDLFAGSGNVGLEALSRGARFATFVEKDIRLVRALQESLVQLGFAARAEVIAADAERGLGRLVQRGIGSISFSPIRRTIRVWSWRRWRGPI